MAQQKEAPRWLWLLLGGGILAYLGYIVVPMSHCHYTGKEAVAVIVNLTTKMEGGGGPDSTPVQRKYYTLAFDGHKIEKRTAGHHKIGDQLPVIYAVGKPDRVVYGKRADGLWRTITRSTNERNLAIATGVAVFFLICAAKTPARKKA